LIDCAQAKTSGGHLNQSERLDDGVVFLAQRDGMSQETLHSGHRVANSDGNLRQVRQSPGPRVFGAAQNDKVEAIPQSARGGTN
jgi:hypothetical protein